jgi:hypothetical protein
MKKEMTVSEGARHAAKTRWANLKGDDRKKATAAARIARAKNRKLDR